MKITKEKLEITPSEVLFWKNIKNIRVVNDKLEFFLVDGQIVEVAQVLPSTIDLIFRTYENYVKDQA